MRTIYDIEGGTHCKEREMMSRTIYDIEGGTHCLEIGMDAPLLDGHPCVFLTITHERLRLAHAQTHEPITLSTGAFWRDVAGGEPSAEDAGELYACRLAHWAAQCASTEALRRLQGTIAHLLTATSSPSISFPPARLDPTTVKILKAYDGTEETTRTLARILGQSPEVVGQWAKTVATPDPEKNALQLAPLPAFPVTLSEEGGAPANETPRPSDQWFRWSEEREQTLNAAIQAAGGLGQMTAATIKETAKELGWPWKSVEYKVSSWKRRAREHHTTKEED